MKPRTVMVILELETDVRLSTLKPYVRDLVTVPAIKVRQVTATVAQPAKEKKVKQ